MPRSQHSGSWPHPLTDTAHSAFYAAHLGCAAGPPHLPPDATIAALGQLTPPPHTHTARLFSGHPLPLHAWSTPPAPRRHDGSILTAVPTPSQTPHTPVFSPPNSCMPGPPHLPPDATIAAFGQLAPPPHRHRTLRISRRRPTLHAWSTPPAPRRHDRCILTDGPTPSQTPHTPVFTPPTFFAIFGSPTCPQRPRWQHSDIWPHPLTTTTNAAFDAAHLRCTPG